MGDWPARLLREDEHGVILAIIVQPAAKHAGIAGIDDWRGRLQIAVQAQPQKGAANEAGCKLLSETFEIAPLLIEVGAGHRSRQKSVRFHGVSLKSIESHLEAFHVE